MRSVVVLVFLLAAGSVAAAPSCFTRPEIDAAHLRVLQQQFNVAALNCQTVDPGAPTFSERYNRFVTLFSDQLQRNSETLRRHFARDQGGLDRWITRIANNAGQAVFMKPDFCQVAWDRLDHVITLDGAQMESYAVETAVARDFAPACPEKPAKKGK